MWNMDTQREEVCIPIVTAAETKAAMIHSAQTVANPRFRPHSLLVACCVQMKRCFIGLHDDISAQPTAASVSVCLCRRPSG